MNRQLYTPSDTLRWLAAPVTRPGPRESSGERDGCAAKLRWGRWQAVVCCYVSLKCVIVAVICGGSRNWVGEGPFVEKVSRGKRSAPGPQGAGWAQDLVQVPVQLLGLSSSVCGVTHCLDTQLPGLAKAWEATGAHMSSPRTSCQLYARQGLEHQRHGSACVLQVLAVGQPALYAHKWPQPAATRAHQPQPPRLVCTTLSQSSPPSADPIPKLGGIARLIEMQKRLCLERTESGGCGHAVAPLRVTPPARRLSNVELFWLW